MNETRKPSQRLSRADVVWFSNNAPEPATKNARSIKNGENNKNNKPNNHNRNNNILFIIMTSKQDIISNIYFDRSGFGSKATTLQDAKKKDASITKEDVEEFFRKNVEEAKTSW